MKKGVLFVEDDAIQILSVKKIISKSDELELIDVARNGKAGLEKFNKFRDKIDIILTDMSMPVMDGLEMIKKIRERDINFPVVIATAYNQKDVDPEQEINGNTTWILKPLEPPEKINKILTNILNS